MNDTPNMRLRFGETRKAFNDPTVDCCDRDAADCDCIESVYTVRILNPGDERALDVSATRRALIAAAAEAGFPNAHIEVEGH